MKFNWRPIGLYIWIQFMSILLVLNLILLFYHDASSFYTYYSDHLDMHYYELYLDTMYRLYLVFLVPIFIITPLVGQIILMFKRAQKYNVIYSYYTLFFLIGIGLYLYVFIQYLTSPQSEPLTLFTYVIGPFYFIWQTYLFQKDI